MNWMTIAELEMTTPMSQEERYWLRCQRLASKLITAGAERHGVQLKGTFVKRDDLVAELGRRGYVLTHDRDGAFFAEVSP
jgi:hypothetical protein